MRLWRYLWHDKFKTALHCCEEVSWSWFYCRHLRSDKPFWMGSWTRVQCNLCDRTLQMGTMEVVHCVLYIISMWCCSYFFVHISDGSRIKTYIVIHKHKLTWAHMTTTLLGSSLCVLTRKKYSFHVCVHPLFLFVTILLCVPNLAL